MEEFINMLKNGLYVFAAALASNSNAITLKSKDTSTKKLKLHIFTVLYQPPVVNGYTNYNDDEKKENDLLLMGDKMTIQQIMTHGTNGVDADHVQFVFTLPESRKEDYEDDNSNHAQNDGFSFSLSAISSIEESTTGIQFLSNVSLSSSEKDKEAVIAEIVLSDDNDRNILLFGLKNLLSSVTAVNDHNDDDDE